MIPKDMVEQYERLAYKIALPFMIGFPALSDDLEGAALLGLCCGIAEAIRKDHPNPGALVVFNVQFELVKCLQESFCVIRLPRSLLRKEKLLAYERGEDFSIAKLYPKIFPFGEQSHPDLIYKLEAKWAEIRQEISEINLTPFEEEVLICRLSDHTFKEIAEDLGCSDVWAVKAMKKVREKWSKRKK